MRHLIESVRKSVVDQNWYAALAGALLLPDIAAKVDGRAGPSSARFISWYTDYLLPKYSLPANSPTVVSGKSRAASLSGRECYALRCAFLHAGEFDLTQQVQMRDVLDRVSFAVPWGGTFPHRSTMTSAFHGKTLVLSVDQFCEDVCVSVENWLNARGADPNVAAAIAGLPQIAVLSSEDGYTLTPKGVVPLEELRQPE